MAFRGRLNLAISQCRKKDGKKGRRFKTVESGLSSALTGSAMRVRELQVGVKRSGVYSGRVHGIYEFPVPPELQRGEGTEP